LAQINSLTLESPDGTLSCRQNNGSPCTNEQIRILNEHVAAPLRCQVRFEYSAAGTANRASTFAGAAWLHGSAGNVPTANNTTASTAQGQQSQGTTSTATSTAAGAAQGQGSQGTGGTATSTSNTGSGASTAAKRQ
jgi:cobalamin biosynthesis Mg chelatase CobN